MHLLLDLDGTITDPRDGIVRSISHALSTLNRPIPAERVLEQYVGPPLVRTFETLLGSTDPAILRSAINAYRERFTSVGIFENRVYPEIPFALSALTRQGFTIHLVTSKPSVFARRILHHFGLSPYFRRIFGPDLDDLTYTKQSLIARALGAEAIPTDAAVMIGDRKEDIEAAKANAVRSIGVTWGYGSREELEGAGAHHIVGSVSELLASLRAV